MLALYLIYLLRRPLTWIFIAGFIAIALSGPVNFLQRRMRRGFAVALVYLGADPRARPDHGRADPADRHAGQQPRRSRCPTTRSDLTTFVQKNEQLRKLEKDYDITSKLEEQAAKLPARLGDAAGVLSDIGVGIVNSLFAAITIIVLSVVHAQQRRAAGSTPSRTATRPTTRAWLKRLYDRIGATVGNYVAGALCRPRSPACSPGSCCRSSASPTRCRSRSSSSCSTSCRWSAPRSARSSSASSRCSATSRPTRSSG